MRPNWRTTLGAATAAVLAATAAAPTHALGSSTPGQADRPIVGSAEWTASGGAATGVPVGASTPRTVTLVTGDRVVVSGAGTDSPSAVVLPNADGTTPTVETRLVGRDLYVYPEGAAAALAAGRADEELFNVTGLIAQGYDDAHTKNLPLIVTYAASVDVARSAPPAPRGSGKGRALRSIDAVAMAADKAKAKDFWADATSSRSAAGSKIRKVWLDRRVTALLDESTTQVNAPAAWAAGLVGSGTTVAVLDTGVDGQHPDLEGRVTDSKDFTGSRGGALSDPDGHGTHTASTVGGSGAASGGREKGVASGADLLIGKVLNDSGSGASSWIIAGMEWAATTEHADVVSMSLGASGAPGDCTDPIASAAQELSESTTSLFVIAAGNAGPGTNTVSSPACAPAVLAVGAVDSSDKTAWFSSRGPAAITHTLKPEIAAPGVAVLAARSGGRGDDAYVAMSGTSMATPHVAGAAAIVKQAHPTWTGAQLKAALVSTAKADVPGDVRETGAGRLDVFAATAPAVTSSPVQAGTFPWPHTAAQSTTVAVPYTNLGATPVTLSLSVTSVTGDDGTALKFSPASLQAATVTVPARGTVTVPLAVDPSVRLEAAQYGDVTGRVVATTPDGHTVSTPFSLYVAPQTVTLTIRMTDRLGHPAAGSSSVDVVNTDSPRGERRYNAGAVEQSYAVRPGTYLLSGFVQSPDAEPTAPTLDSIAYFARPELTVTGDTTVDFDARTAHEITVKTDQPSVARSTTLAFTRQWSDQWVHAGSMSGGSTVRSVFADVQSKPQNGTWELGTFERRLAPAVSSMTAAGLTLHPTVPDLSAAGLDGTGSAPLVDGGSGTATDLTADKVGGKVALVRLTSDYGNLTAGMVRAAQSAGVKGLLLYRPVSGRWAPSAGLGPVGVTAYSLPVTEGEALRSALAAAPSGQLTVAWTATARSPYVYNLGFTETTPLTDDKTYVVHDRKLGRTDATYTAMGLAGAFIDYVQARRPSGITLGVSGFNAVPVPGARTEFYTDGGTEWTSFVMSSLPWGESMLGTWHRYPEASVRTETWHAGVVSPTAIQDRNGVEKLTAERQGDLMGFAPQLWGDGFGHVAAPGGFGDAGSLELKKDGQSIGTSPFPSGVFEVPAGAGRYELTLSQFKLPSAAPMWKRSMQVTTTWGFDSVLEPGVFSRGLPLIFPRVALPEDGVKTVPAQAGLLLPVRLTGHAGYTPGAITSLHAATSYDGGTTWTDATVRHTGDDWDAVVDHTGASGKTVTLRVTVTDANGATVTQLTQAAYAVR
ncbi:S8 family serine peptidase [Humibacillus xanthopallidus]|uniref:Subtilisin family serine protease n=1 Tax=Humibacillus xanthopallidus TaxID=412689 RepID=A0A543I1Q3_9MICO|nr:S8 family serine peptidase [Humibacillus xanthopallidus]TQM64523.1 subtilisin family serine protease [Humibacillus xanthopallidus]